MPSRRGRAPTGGTNADASTATSPFTTYSVSGNDVTFFTPPAITGVNALTFTKQ